MSTEPDEGKTFGDAKSGTAESGTPRWRRAIRLVGLLVFLAVVAVFVVYAVPQVIGADHSYVVLTASMSPEIEPGDVVVVGEVEPAAIEEGDVITFYRSTDEPPVTHRVIGVTETDDGYLYETKGDANEQPDANPVPHENVVGTVVVTLPYLGHVIQFANTTEGFLALVVFPFGLLLLSEAYSITRSSPKGADSEAETGEAEDAGIEASETGDGDDFAFTPTKLRTAIGTLAIVAPVSIYLAVWYPTAITVAVAVAASVSFLVAVGIRFVGAGGGGGSGETVEANEPDDLEGTEEFGPERAETGEPVGDGAGGTVDDTDAGSDPGEESR